MTVRSLPPSRCERFRVVKILCFSSFCIGNTTRAIPTQPWRDFLNFGLEKKLLYFYYIHFLKLQNFLKNRKFKIPLHGCVGIALDYHSARNEPNWGMFTILNLSQRGEGQVRTVFDLWRFIARQEQISSDCFLLRNEGEHYPTRPWINGLPWPL